MAAVLSSASISSAAATMTNVTAPSSSRPQVVIEGTLLKQGSRSQQYWHERYFAFYSDHTLKYYLNQDDKIPKRIFNVSQLSDCEVSDLYVKKHQKQLIYCVKLMWSGDASTTDNSVDTQNMRGEDVDDYSSMGDNNDTTQQSLFDQLNIGSKLKRSSINRFRKSSSKRRSKLFQKNQNQDRDCLSVCSDDKRQRQSFNAKILGLATSDEGIGNGVTDDSSFCEGIPSLVEVNQSITLSEVNPQNGDSRLRNTQSAPSSFLSLHTPLRERHSISSETTPVYIAPVATSTYATPRTPYQVQSEEEQQYLQSQFFLTQRNRNKGKTKQMLVTGTQIAALAGAAIGLTVVTAGIAGLVGMVIFGVGAGVSGGGAAMKATWKKKVTGEIVLASPDYDTARMWKACFDASRESISIRTSRWGQLFVSEGRTTNAAVLPPALDVSKKEIDGYDGKINFEFTTQWEPVDAGLASFLWSGMNGLRLFREERNVDSGFFSSSSYDGRPCPPMKVQAVINATPLDTFLCLMSFGRMTEASEAKNLPNSEQRSSFRILQSIDDHADIIHLVMRPLYLFPSWTSPRDFVLFRYWRLEQDGSYVVCYESMQHSSCPPLPTHVRSDMHQVITIAPQKKSYLRRAAGGYNSSKIIVTPQDCYVTAVTHVDPKGWVPVGRLPFFPNQSYGEAFAVAALSQIVEIRDAIDQDRFVAVSLDCKEQDHFVRAYQTHSPPSFVRNRSTESDRPDDNLVDDCVNYDFSYSGHEATRLRCTADNDFAATPPPFEAEKWAEPDSNSFRVRGATYLIDTEKINAGPSIGRLLAADVVLVDEPLFTGFSKHPTERIQLALQREARIRQKGKQSDLPPFIFVVNVSLPGPPFYHGVFYYAIDDMSTIDGTDGTPSSKLCKEFFFGDDDEFRDRTFKLIPQIVQGNYIVRKAVGSTPAIMGKKLRQLYVKGDRFFEVILDCGSSSVATGVIRLSLGYAKSLVIDMGFLFEGDDSASLPERIMGCVRMKQIDFGPHLRKVDKVVRAPAG